MPAVFTIPTILTYGTVYCGVFAYTEKLRNTMNPDTKELWTRAERTAEAQRLYPRAALCLAAEFLEDESLRTIGHPASRKSEADFAWKPPEVGFIKVRSHLTGTYLLWHIPNMASARPPYWRIPNMAGAQPRMGYSAELGHGSAVPLEVRVLHRQCLHCDERVHFREKA